jgi:hypothetical protein
LDTAIAMSKIGSQIANWFERLLSEPFEALSFFLLLRNFHRSAPSARGYTFIIANLESVSIDF